MKVYENDIVIMCDCDDTLVMWNTTDMREDDFYIEPVGWGEKVKLRPHRKHIELIKQFAARGQMVVVWSAGGFAWAKQVVEVLKLEKYVTVVMSKPKWFVDDLQAKEILGQRIYMADNSKPKKEPMNGYDDTDVLTARIGLVNMKDYDKSEEEE